MERETKIMRRHALRVRNGLSASAEPVGAATIVVPRSPRWVGESAGGDFARNGRSRESVMRPGGFGWIDARRATSHANHIATPFLNVLNMPPGVVYDGVEASGEMGQGIFAGQRLWFSRNVPARKHIMELAQANGAVVVADEKEADILLVDHAKRPAPPSTHSYRYVELSVRRGKLENLSDHAVGAVDRASRPVGSVMTAPKGSRTPFTEEDDQFLWDFVKPYEEMGGAIGGNAIYKDLEAVNPRHTFQAWRDRYLKKARFQNRQIKNPNIAGLGTAKKLPQAQVTMSHENATQQASSSRVAGRSTMDGNEDAEDQQIRPKSVNKTIRPTRRDDAAKRARDSSPDSSTVPLSEQIEWEPFEGEFAGFTSHDATMLFKAAPAILDSDEASLESSWQRMADSYRDHTAREWRRFFEIEIVPRFLRPSARKTHEKSGHDKDSAQSPKEHTVRSKVDFVDQGVQTSPLRASDNESPPRTMKTAHHFGSPEFRPDSPSTGRAPEPNESRKRSMRDETKSSTASQEPVPASKSSVNRVPVVDGSSDSDQSEFLPQDSEQKKSPSKRKRVVSGEEDPVSPSLPSLEDLLEAPRQKRTKRTHFNEASETEIPSTPPKVLVEVIREEIEITEVFDGDEDDGIELPVLRPVRATATPSETSEISETRSSPTPRATATRPIDQTTGLEPSEATDSPLFFSSDSEAEVLESIKAELRQHKEIFQRGKANSTKKAEDDEEDEDQAEDQIGQTSPLSLKLVSEQDAQPASSLSHAEPQGARHENTGEDEETEDFETAPDTEPGEAWETAPEGPSVRANHDTMPESSKSLDYTSESNVAKERTDTQALFEGLAHHQTRFMMMEDAFALPEPEGGWTIDYDNEVDVNDNLVANDEDALDKGESGETTETEIAAQRQQGDQQRPTRNRPHDRPDTFTTTTPNFLTRAEFDTYVDEQLAANPDLDEVLLLTAIDATCMDLALVPRVYHHLAQGRGLPPDLPGCWTPEDDRLLDGGDARAIELVERKHGAEGLRRRWMFRDGDG